MTTSSDGPQQRAPDQEWPEPFPGVLPPERPLEELSQAEVEALSDEDVGTYLADLFARDASVEHLPHPIREAFRLHVLGKIQELGQDRFFLPDIAQPPEPPPRESATEVDDEVTRRLQWQESWDEKRDGYAPSPAEVDAARAAATRDVDELQRVAVIEEQQLEAARHAQSDPSAGSFPG